jgi:hypothetical protein
VGLRALLPGSALLAVRVQVADQAAIPSFRGQEKTYKSGKNIKMSATFDSTAWCGFLSGSYLQAHEKCV